MASLLRRMCWVGLFLTAVGLTGCNLLALPFFIFGPEPTREPDLKKLADGDKKKEVKIAILASSTMEMKPEFIRADRDVSQRLRTVLKASFEYNKENVKIVSPRRVEDFQNANPDWPTMDLEEVGKQLGADYLVYLEIKDLTLFEAGSRNTLYRGRADIRVSLISVNDPDEGPMRKDFLCQFPSEIKQGIPIDADTTPEKFKNDFLNYVAQRLSWYFTKHPTRVEQDCQ